MAGTSVAAQRENAFQAWWNNGYKGLIPVIPPDAKISEKSYILKNKSAGKAPGVMYDGGYWGGMPGWREHETTQADVARWHEMGASVGLRRGDAFLLDIDAYDAATADLIEQTALEMLGPAPCRIGLAPKRALLYRADGEIPNAKLLFDGDPPGQIEIPAQAVIWGIHKSTGKPYTWPRKPTHIDKLSIVTPAKLNAFMEAMRAVLPKAKRADTHSAADRDSINQAALAGSPDLIAQAMERMPNTREHFPTYDDMIRVGNALSASLPYDRELARELWHDWCERWEGGDSDHELTDKRWGTIKPPHAYGARYIYDLADRIAPRDSGSSYVALSWFEDLTTKPLNPFEEIRAKEETQRPQIDPTPYRPPALTDIEPRHWVYGTHYIRKFVSVTLAPSGVGKSSLSIVEALAMASGRPLLGVQPEGRHRVWLWNGEDPRDELDRRIAAAMLHYEIKPEDIEGWLFVDSGRDTELVMASEGKDGVHVNQDLVARITERINTLNIDVLVLDPFISTHRVNENDNGAIDRVAKRWGAIANTCHCSIEIVHHVRKLHGAETQIDDGRGAGALIAASRTARALTKMTKGEASVYGIEQRWRFFRFSDGNSNLAPPATENTQWMEMLSVGLHNDRMAVDREGKERPVKGDVVGVVRRADLWGAASAAVEPDTQAEALRLISEGQWRLDTRAGDIWVGVPIGLAMGLDYSDEDDRKRIKVIIKGMLDAKIVSVVNRKDAGRKLRPYVEVAKIADKLSENLFD